MAIIDYIKDVRDYTYNKNNAMDLIENLRSYWSMRGYPHYKFWLEKVIENKGDTSKATVRYEIRSDIKVRPPRLDEI